MSLLSSFSQQKLKSSYFNCSVLQSKPLCTIVLTFQNQSLNIPIYINSKINKIADEISNNFCEKYELNLNEQLEQIHNFICYRLAQQIRRVIITQDQRQCNKDNQWSDSLLDILASHLKYQQEKSKSQANLQLDNTKDKMKNQSQQCQMLSTKLEAKINKISYFQKKINIQKKVNTFEAHEDKKPKQSIKKTQSLFFLPMNKKAKSKKNISDKQKHSKLIQYSLYNKSKEILTRKKQNALSREKEKLKTQTKQCTFHPDISLSSQKYKKTGRNNSFTKLISGKTILSQQNNVFQKLYSNAQQIKSKKNFFRVKTEQAITLQQNKQLTFAPKINECSKQIIKMKKQAAYIPFFYNDESKQNWKQKTSTTYSDTQKFIQTDKNKKSKHLKQITLKTCNSSSNITVFQKLFKNDNKSFKKKKQKQNCQYSFRPQLSKGTKKLLKEKDFPTLKQRVAVNQSYFQKAASKKSLMSIQKYLQSLQLKEQQKNFRNVVIDDQENQQQSQNNLNQYNHSLSSIVLIDNSNKKISSEPSKIDDNQDKINEPQVKRSQKLFNNRKNKIFHQIFIKLTQNQSNHLTENIELTHKMIYEFKQFPETVRSIFIKIGQQMERLNVGLDEDEFVWSLSNTYQHLSLTEKGMLLGWGVKQLRSQMQQQK